LPELEWRQKPVKAEPLFGTLQSLRDEPTSDYPNRSASPVPASVSDHYLYTTLP
jgi:hypothetical protein